MSKKDKPEENQAKILPFSIPVERALLGAILVRPKAILDALPFVEPADFYQPVHAAMFSAMMELDSAGIAIDPLSVAERMRARDTFKYLKFFEDEVYFSTLGGAAIAVAPEHVAEHARIVATKARKRRVMETLDQYLSLGYKSQDDEDYLDQAEAGVSACFLGRWAREGTYEHIRGALKRAIHVIEERYTKKNPVSGVPWGFARVDEITGGLQPGHYVVLAGRPKMGKSAMAQSVVLHAAIARQIPCCVISLEMSDQHLVERALSAEGRVDSVRLRNGYFTQTDWMNLTRAATRIAEAPISLFHGEATFSRIRSLLRRWRSKETVSSELALAVVDYIGLITPDRGKNKPWSREQEIAEWSRGFKALAIELSCPVLLLSQLNRAAEQRRRPTMSDLRESGALEQDADLVALVYRDEVYNHETDEKGIAEVIIGANRHGPVGTVKLKFQAEYTRFDSLPDDWQPPPPKPNGKNGRNGNGRHWQDEIES